MEIGLAWQLTYLQSSFRSMFRGMPQIFRYRHQLMFFWLIFLQIVASGPKTLVGLSRSGPSWVAEWRFRRLLSAAYWHLGSLIFWFSSKAISAFPPSQEGVMYVITDGSKKEKRGKKNPAAQKGRESKHHFWFFGIRFVVLMVAWDVYRIPVDFRMVLPKTHPDYKNENQLFREMLENFNPPSWVRTVIVLADAGFASKENLKLIQKRNKSDHKRLWGFVFSMARTWKMQNGKSLKNLVKHTPSSYYKRTWIPRFPENGARKTFWTFTKSACLRHIGDVTIVISKKGRNVGPKKAKVLVTNLPDVTTRQVLLLYQRRWSIEILFKELKTGLGMGQHQVTANIDRIEKSLGIAIISYLVLLRARSKDIKPGKSWSIFQLKSNFSMDMVRNQIEHNWELRTNELLKAA